jgi:hypothetical protein
VCQELENRALGLASDEGAIVRDRDSAESPREVTTWMGRVTHANRKFGTSGIEGRRTKSLVLQVASADPSRS